MSENSSYRNRALYEATIALVEMGRASKPQITADGQRPPTISPLPADLSFRFAMNRNSLRPIGEAIEEEQKALREKHDIEKHRELKTAEERTAFAEAVTAYEAENRTLLNQEIEWRSPAPVRIAQLGERAIPDEWLASWLAVGIVVGELPPDETLDAKKPKEAKE